MKRIFVDTNYFLRFLRDDGQKQAEIVRALFEKAVTDEVVIFTSILVFFELYWVTKSVYKKNKLEVIHLLKKFLSMHFVQIEEKEQLNEAVILYEKRNIELEDCYNLSFAKYRRAQVFATFDKKIKYQE